MSIVEARRKKRQARCEDGIYFPSDEFIELCGTPGSGYRADLGGPVSTLLHATPDGWTHLCELCSSEVGDLVVFAGSTSSEGAGFVAAEQRSTGKLLWLLHLSDSEQFIEVSCDGSTVHAISDEYPNQWLWRIPVAAPESFTVEQARCD